MPRLKLKWSFGLPGATHVYGQPTVVAGRVFVAADSGYVYSLNAGTGCVYWSYLAEGAVRTAVNIAQIKGGEYAAFFGDLKGNVYAVNARTGAKMWMVQVEDHPLTRLTGAPKVYENRLYVPVASADEGSAAEPHYPCCTFRGSVVALDTSTGKQIWKTYTIPEKPKFVQEEFDRYGVVGTLGIGRVELADHRSEAQGALHWHGRCVHVAGGEILRWADGSRPRDGQGAVAGAGSGGRRMAGGMSGGSGEAPGELPEGPGAGSRFRRAADSERTAGRQARSGGGTKERHGVGARSGQ